MVATTAATGLRVWLAAKAPQLLAGRRKAWLSGLIVTGGVLAAGIAA